VVGPRTITIRFSPCARRTSPAVRAPLAARGNQGAFPALDEDCLNSHGTPTMHAQQMISTHPHVKGSTNEALIRCIEECYDYAQTCTSCADACLGEEMVQHLV
jgi:hypothetical protein